MRYFSGARVNQVVNKYLNGHLSRFCNWSFSALQKMMLTELLLDKEIDDAGNRW